MFHFAYLLCFQVIADSCSTLECRNGGLDAPQRQKRQARNPELEVSVLRFLVLLLQVAFVSPLQIVVNVRPKLLKFIP